MKKDKADDVYEQLMLNYNEQIDEIRKNKRRAKYQEKKENEKIKQNSVVITNPDYIKKASNNANEKQRIYHFDIN